MKQKLLDAHEEQNIEAYTEAVSSSYVFHWPIIYEMMHALHYRFWLFAFQIREFDSITRLDQWQTTMLLRIKKTIQDEENDLR